MLFLIEYDRTQGRLVSIREFADSETAETARIDLELKLNRSGVDREVVLLEAASQQALRKTHRRYFEDLSELAKAS
jgi:hypothetical protein